MSLPKALGPKVLVIGASPDITNPNVVLRNLVVAAFKQVLGDNQVMNAPFEERLSACERFGPDLILVFGSCAPAVCDYSALRKASMRTGAHLAFWLHEDPYEFDHHTKVIDVADSIFTNDLGTSQHYHRERVFHLPLAATPDVHYRVLSHENRTHDVFFCGVAFPNRVQAFDDIEHVLEQYRSYVCGQRWLTGNPKIYRNHRIAYERLPDYYAQSRLVINIGREFDLANSAKLVATTPAPRTFEAAMAGCVQLYLSSSSEIDAYFLRGTEIIVVNTAEQLGDEIERFVNDAQSCHTIAANAQARALRDHCYVNRVKRILQFCVHCC